MTARVLAPHGTRSAAERHRNRCEPLCQPCTDAARAYERQRWQRRQAAAAQSRDTTDTQEIA